MIPAVGREECPAARIGRPEVSVLMPAYNCERYIGDAIDSILGQTFGDFELIVIDDASTDRTWEVVLERAGRDHRIVALRNDANLGIAGNRNRGVAKARGRYVAWQDSDDISMPDRLELQHAFLEAHPEVGIVGGFLEFFDDSGVISVRRYAPDDASLRRTIFRFSPVAQPAAMIRKSVLDEAGEYDPAYPPAEDLDMSFRIGCRHRFANIQKVVIRYRQHPCSATFTRLKTIELNTLEIRRRFFRHPAYRVTFLDRLYNMLQRASIHTVPYTLKIRLFNALRNHSA